MARRRPVRGRRPASWQNQGRRDRLIARAANVWAVLAAAGGGRRLGSDRPKAFVRLGERPLLAESLERLDASPWIDAMVVAAPPGWEEPVILLAEELGCAKLTACVPGGDTRAASVRAALAEVPADAAVVVVHDAARPFVSDGIIQAVIAPLAEGWDGAVPGLPIADTVKRVAHAAVVETLDRGELVAVQTPQGFVGSVLRDAVVEGDASDCASLVERRGGRVHVVPGDRRLLKVTTKEDLELVASWL